MYTAYYKHCSMSTAMATHVRQVEPFPRGQSVAAHHWSGFSCTCRINNSTTVNVTWGDNRSSRLLIFLFCLLNKSSENGVQSQLVISMSYLRHLAILMVTQRDHAENELLIVKQVFLCLFISLSFVNFNLLVFLLRYRTVLFLCRHHSAKLLI